jgi:hypothetical protein
MSLKDPPFVRLKDSSKGFVGYGPAPGQHVVGLLAIPPGTGALEANMTDALVSGLEAAASDGRASLPGRAVVQPPGPAPQKADPLPDLLGGRAITWRQGRQPLDRPVPLAPEQAGHHGFHPCVLRLRVLATLQAPHRVHVLAAVIVVQELHGGGKQGFDLLPDPCRPIAEPTQAHLVRGDQPGGFDLPPRRGGLLVRLHWVPAPHLHEPLLIP